MVNALIGSPSISRGSVIYFPAGIYGIFSELDELFPLRKNPFGAFAGLIFPVKYTYRTVQSPIMEWSLGNAFTRCILNHSNFERQSFKKINV
jgi:hypothetical protein